MGVKRRVRGSLAEAIRLALEDTIALLCEAGFGGKSEYFLLIKVQERVVHTFNRFAYP